MGVISRLWRNVRAVSLAGTIAAVAARGDVVLGNALWRVEVTPETLATRVVVAGQAGVPVSSGVARHVVSRLNQAGTEAKWAWDAGALQVTLALVERDLMVTVTSQAAATVTLLRQPGEAYGKALILPLAEGSYVPRGNAVWRAFLLRQAAVNTTENLSLPLWGMDYGAFSLHWLMTEPFHNSVAFAEDAKGVRLTLSHQFTRMEPKRPMTMLLHLGGADVLAGAKRYRAWIIDHQQFEPMAKKLERVPDGAKLLGATHVYVWGGGLMAARDVKDWALFAARLNGDDALSRGVRERMEAEPRGLLRHVRGTPNRHEQTVLVRGVDDALDAWARESWQTAKPDLHLLVTRYGELADGFARAMGDAMNGDRAEWGSGLSIDTVKQLQRAGLGRLWLGIGDGWEGGLWHPAAVWAAVAAGFLIAPYDSYDTALPAAEDSAWATAHLGDRGYGECAITLADGSVKAGFQKKGHYTNPECMRPILEERVRALEAATGFNSWFLDSYAAGMLFDDYGKAHPMGEAAMADAESASMAWVGDALRLPVGSEDGNAVTARGIFFAHGMEAPVIGWGDAEMQRNGQSPYFLGRWYPPEQPAIFFNAVPLKDALRTIHFDPRFRLPLYQTVFHDSVITTNHWSYDNLKFTNARVENELTQLLYNVPGLFHLSAETLAQRVPAMQKQSAFFGPLHARLARQAMVGFAWLTQDHLVQQTRFADGTRITANFDPAERVVHGARFAGWSVTATGVGSLAQTSFNAR